jgi:nicotinamidase-related amidase
MILLVVDMQKALTEDEELYDAEAFMDRNIRLIDAARKNNVEVIFVQHDAGEGSGFSAGDEDFEIDPRVAPKEGEKVFVKTINSCFGNKEFKAYMEQQEDKRLMVIGLQTNYCIDATVKSAFERGYYVAVPEDAHSTFDNPYMNGETTCAYYFHEVWPGLFADCVSMDEALKMLKGQQ